MLYHMDRIWLLVFLGGFVVPELHHVWGIEIYTTKEVEAVNGTNVKLKCTFSSTHPVSPQTVTVSWMFRPINSQIAVRMFYYQEVPYPPDQGLFKGHAVWSGDINGKDASVTLHEVQPTFNGTYICQVANPPDAHGNTGETVLRVVDKVSLSEIGLLAAIVGGSCGVILVLLSIFVAVRFYRRRQKERFTEMEIAEYIKKEPTVCSPAEAVHLTALKMEIEVGSSDDQESKPSNGDDKEEKGLGDGDDEDDDNDKPNKMIK
ncbi:myelin protein zero-like protein 2b [Girardinichthys multiradiatus]|uniref:myelin protein zero-like protein 2b n=1 Tax=Girardinichthys multiradiatus TaxID=208333 RepID=UPI001FABE89B|nr:myelin protein zero-like protein 2b [Girardinichthys multiradiatus]